MKISAFIPSMAISIAGTAIIGSNVNAQTFSNISNLNRLNCQGTCYTIGIQNSPGGNGLQPSTDLRFGISFDLDRTEADRLKTTTQRYNNERQQAKQTFTAQLQQDLTVAIDRQQYDRARILAIQLSPRLGYKNYRRYLMTISGGNFPNP